MNRVQRLGTASAEGAGVGVSSRARITATLRGRALFPHDRNPYAHIGFRLEAGSLRKAGGYVSAREKKPVVPEDDGWCFVCGPENPISLRTRWKLDEDGMARTRFTPSRRHQGWAGVVHGGILASLLDEAVVQRTRLEGKPTVTASLSIRFQRPVPTETTIIAEAGITAEKPRVMRLHASIRDESGTCYAEAEGTCVRVKEKI